MYVRAILDTNSKIVKCKAIYIYISYENSEMSNK